MNNLLKRGLRVCFVILSLLIISTSIYSCVQETKQTETSKPVEVKYNSHITAFTSGVVSNSSEITVHFANSVNGAEAGVTCEPNSITFTPKIEGTAKWLNSSTIIFKPSKLMLSGTTYKVRVNLQDIIKSEGEDKYFDFSFETLSQNVNIETEAALPYDTNNKENNHISGKLMFADNISTEAVKKSLSATQDGMSLDIEWKDNSDNKTFYFDIQNVKRKESSSSVEIIVKRESINTREDLTSVVSISPISHFGIERHNVVKVPNQMIEIIFSDVLSQSQNLDGLITLTPNHEFTTEIDNNIIKIYPKRVLTGEVYVEIKGGIKDMYNGTMGIDHTLTTEFEELKPQVEYIGRGTILPESSGLTMPFRAISLNHVQVKIIKIYESNVAMFLQYNNSLDGNINLRQAGRIVYKKTIALNMDKSLDLNKWNTFSLDIADMVKLDRGAIYRIELDFKRKHTNYADDLNYNFAKDDIISDSELDYYTTPGNGYYEYMGDDEYYYYSWRERENPASDAYYHSERRAVRNILASDLGMIVKKGSSNTMLVAVTNLLTTNPIANVDIEIYDYQNQLIGRSKTNSEGLVNIDITQKPFLLIAKHNNQRGYMRLDEASALSMTNFDVSGEKTKQGVKGFIYGERGVWRPGDDMFISFILEDKEGVIPVGHPIQFELRNAAGRIVRKQTLTVDINNMYCIEAATDNKAATGNWEARFIVGGSVFYKRLRVESIKPNRLKIDIDFKSDVITAKSGRLEADMKATWLHGADADRLKAKVEATLSSVKTQFNNFKGYEFDDPTKSYSSQEITLYDGSTDSEGHAEISKDISGSYSSPGLLRVSLRSRVFEASGDFSTSSSSTVYSPYSVYVGIKAPKGDDRNTLLTDKIHDFEVVRVGEDGELIRDNTSLKYYIYKVGWRWWWQTSDENLAQYINSSSNALIESGEVDIVNGKGTIPFEVKYPKWGRYLVRVIDSESNHSTGETVMIDWPGYSNKPMGDDIEAASILSITSSKKRYDVDSKADITFASSGGGRALVTIENGTSILREYWVETKPEFTTFSFDIDKSMTPNIYVSVTMLQPHEQTKNNLPIRMYGVVPISVDDKSTHITPVISMAKELKPKEEAAITVSESNGEPMTYTLAVVEDGLLDLTNYKTPTPYGYFYAREALGVRTWDIFNNVIGAYGGKIESVFGIGGDIDMMERNDPVDANRFEPMVRVFGPFTIKAGESKTHKFDMPQYIGSVRTMVVARSGRKYGTAEITTPVRKPLMVLATMPRVASINDEINLPVTIFAMDSSVKDVEVSVETNNLFSIDGESSSRLSFNKIGDKLVDFKLKVSDIIGVGKVKVIAKSGSERAEHEIEIAVRNPNPIHIISHFGMVKPSSTIEIPYELFGSEGTNRVWIETSTIQPIDYDRRLKYLKSYPHQCVEQTTSSVFPLLYADKFCELTPEEKSLNESKVREAITRLANYINSDGGFGYWAGESNTNDWGTSYAGHFLLEAEKLGYTLPYNFKSRWIKYQNEAASSWKSKWGQLNQAYRLYTLALAGEPNNSAMNRMLNNSDLSYDAAYRLAAAYAIIGRDKVAKELLLRNFKKSSDDYNYSYGSPLRNQAMILETLSLLNDDKAAAPIIKEVSETLSSDEWLSTQTLAYSMIALSKWIPNNSNNNMIFSYGVKGNSEQKVQSERALYVKEITTNIPSKGEIVVKNSGDINLFARVVVQGAPIEGETKRRNENLDISVEYKDIKGNPIDVTNIKQGSDFMAIVTISHPGKLNHYKDMVLTQIFPSGWEIRNMRMDGGALPIKANEPRYVDYRDDRVYSYFDISQNRSVKYVVMLNASYKGRFYLPAVVCEAMYDRSIMANTTAKWVKVY